MDTKETKHINVSLVKRLVTLLEASSLHEIKVETQGTSIYLAKPGVSGVQQQAVQAPPPPPIAQPSVAKQEELPDQQGKPVTSPMVGTFYCSPSPQSEPYVKVGDKVEKGDILCIVEAMKMMNHIKASHAGTVTAIHAVDGNPVEYGQTLLVLKP